MGNGVLGFEDIDSTQVELVGGKGAHLGELARVEGIRVPAGFCVTTGAFRRVLADAPSIEGLLGRLSRLGPDDREAICEVSAAIRRTIEEVPVPDDLTTAISRRLSRLGEHGPYAVRSSATAEDSPTTSFAGQHDTYLNVVGQASIVAHVSRCWASLFTERAVVYRLRNGIDHRRVHMAVVVQQMVSPHTAGTMFTADPVTGDRGAVAVEASFGLGEALVSGRVDPDVFKVRDDDVVETTIGSKTTAIAASPEGGTLEQAIEPERRSEASLTRDQVLRLARIGRRIEAHFGRPQDIEWCLVDDGFWIVQSRPITTLYPVPAAGDRENRVYVSVGHGQMMTDAMRPLGISFWQLTAARPMHEAGGRLFVDVTASLTSPTTRAGLLEVMGTGDPLTRDALETVLERGGFIRTLADAAPSGPRAGAAPAPIETDPAIVAGLIARTQASIAAMKREIGTKSGPELIDFILADLGELKRILFDPQGHQVFMSAMEAARWLNDQLRAWLGETNAADTLTQSVPDNVTSEMGLALLDVADVIRPHPGVVAFLSRVEDDGFLDEMDGLEGGPEAREAIRAWLDKYGMRCVGEIDITRPRWSERPSALVPLILGNVRNFGPGEGARRFERGRQEAATREQELLQRLRTLPDGAQRAEQTQRMIDRVRTFIGYREYPKYGMVSRYFVYKQALLEEATRLVRAGVIREPDDIFYLSVGELADVVRTHRVDDGLIRRRKDEFRAHQALTPPRVLTSDGLAVAGAYRRDDLPAGALAGLAVSAGTVEGRARVILDMADADLEPGDILVTASTDPSWTPLFVAIGGLVTEVGGLMTHGAVIAREYGLPAVVGVEGATRLIPDGRRVRVHGTEGYVEVLPDG